MRRLLSGDSLGAPKALIAGVSESIPPSETLFRLKQVPTRVSP